MILACIRPGEMEEAMEMMLTRLDRSSQRACVRRKQLHCREVSQMGEFFLLGEKGEKGLSYHLC